MWNPGYGPGGIDFLLINFTDFKVAEEVDLTKPGWANLINATAVDVTSEYARL